MNLVKINIFKKIWYGVTVLKNTMSQCYQQKARRHNITSNSLKDGEFNATGPPTPTSQHSQGKKSLLNLSWMQTFKTCFRIEFKHSMHVEHSQNYAE